MPGNNKLTTQTKEKRVKNFDEVVLGFSKKVAQEEARRCPQCNHPQCVEGCPLGIDIPAFIRLLREGDDAGAHRKIFEKNLMPGICGRLCPAPCERACILNAEEAPINIRALERYAADHARQQPGKQKGDMPDGDKVAVIGSGPSGLTAAGNLAREGYSVTIFEMLSQPGGTLNYLVPEFRLPQNVLKKEIETIRVLGVEIRELEYIGRTRTLNHLFSDNYKAILIATGCGGAKYIDMPGVHSQGVYYGEEILFVLNNYGGKNFARHRSVDIGEEVAVIGSGNTALDCARACKRAGAKVSVIFEGTKEDLSVYRADCQAAEEEEISFNVLTRPLEILGDNGGHACAVKCEVMDYADPGSDGKWVLMPVPESEFIIDATTVILACGQKGNQDIKTIIPDIKMNNDGTIWTDKKSFMTSCPAVFAAGEVLLGHDNLVQVMALAKQAANDIVEYLR